jgi:hypothetical protein
MFVLDKPLLSSVRKHSGLMGPSGCLCITAHMFARKDNTVIFRQMFLVKLNHRQQ